VLQFVLIEYITICDKKYKEREPQLLHLFERLSIITKIVVTCVTSVNMQRTHKEMDRTDNT
jgi:16S rRNA G1207 methylase RsmC